MRYSLEQATRELLFLPVPSQARVKAKAFIDVFVQRGAKGMAALLLLRGTSVLDDLAAQYIIPGTREESLPTKESGEGEAPAEPRCRHEGLAQRELRPPGDCRLSISSQ